MDLFFDSTPELSDKQAVLFEVVGNKEEGSLEIASISLNAIVGTPTPQTMRVLGLINNRQVVILIDTCITCNFLDVAVVKKCKLVVLKGRLI